ncbi:uncharacterized protein MELLADRAFT_116539 [Melampsora larici-populina 98AG31]|uniref:Uncharacterized protein n=1 Tax=Melampsora larici-populina (strain 98AG31 / pathotype 3-4-7) TaxID=747676 RepID=F4RMH5_MELLP|nr:uncharacterized protein MELLADRAFT_116539 [Melampsora larici-populina 98AG31]EGG06471.1 hypothetical protein MELLADRAFT_116539 [Melampsora larici-populina 98AG31]
MPQRLHTSLAQAEILVLNYNLSDQLASIFRPIAQVHCNVGGRKRWEHDLEFYICYAEPPVDPNANLASTPRPSGSDIGAEEVLSSNQNRGSWLNLWPSLKIGTRWLSTPPPTAPTLYFPAAQLPDPFNAFGFRFPSSAPLPLPSVASLYHNCAHVMLGGRQLGLCATRDPVQQAWRNKERLHNSTGSVAKVDHAIPTRTPSESAFSFSQLLSIASPYLRLARLHTIMAWAVFPAPALYTAILFHATQLPDVDSWSKLTSCFSLCASLFVCVMCYRAAGLAWDDLLDRDYDAQVTRSKSRPLPSGQLTLDGAMIFIAFLSGLTSCLLLALFPIEVFMTFLLSSAIFVPYPYLKRVTHYTQFFGSFLISMGVIQAWVACAMVHTPVEGVKSGLSQFLAILSRDSCVVAPIFLMEYLFGQYNPLLKHSPMTKRYRSPDAPCGAWWSLHAITYSELAHELIYGCQDTDEDIEIGLFSLSILCGYERSRQLGFVLICGFAGLVGYCASSADLPWSHLTVIPVIWLLFNFWGLNLAIPSSCSAWASKAIKTKGLVTFSFAVLFCLREFDVTSSTIRLLDLLRN